MDIYEENELPVRLVPEHWQVLHIRWIVSIQQNCLVLTDRHLNSMDGVSDRDYLIELLSALSTIMMHLSRFSEEVIIWNTNEYQFVEIDDAYSTGSSIMPQKKNPDIAELVRGKTGRVYGALDVTSYNDERNSACI